MAYALWVADEEDSWTHAGDFDDPDQAWNYGVTIDCFDFLVWDRERSCYYFKSVTLEVITVCWAKEGF